MSKDKMPAKNGKCIRSNGCAAWQYFAEDNPGKEFPECERCGWNVQEDARRKAIPLTLCSDGLRRKIIPPRQSTVEDAETEVRVDG